MIKTAGQRFNEFNGHTRTECLDQEISELRTQHAEDVALLRDCLEWLRSEPVPNFVTKVKFEICKRLEKE